MLPEFKNILYATDLSEHSPLVFRYAMSLAQRYDGAIAIVHAVEPLGSFAQSMVELYVTKEKREELQGEGQRKMLEEIRGRLETFCAEELCTDQNHRNRVQDVRVLEGRPAEVILKEAQRIRADLIVMGSHGHTAVGEILLGTTAHRVMQRATVPVFLVRAGKE